MSVFIDFLPFLGNFVSSRHAVSYQLVQPGEIDPLSKYFLLGIHPCTLVLNLLCGGMKYKVSLPSSRELSYLSKLEHVVLFPSYYSELFVLSSVARQELFMLLL